MVSALLATITVALAILIIVHIWGIMILSSRAGEIIEQWRIDALRKDRDDARARNTGSLRPRGR